jgi:molybdenum cofactor cytidylyltransferase
MLGGAGLAEVGVVVLAAGAGSRFGGGKLLAELEGRPLLEHVLDAVRAVRPACCVVVLGADAALVEGRVGWAGETRLVNPEPHAGLASSLRLGVAECRRLLPDAAGVLVVLGDQPRTSPEVIRTLVDAAPQASATGAWAVVPRYAAGGGANPALVLPAGLAQVPGLSGDRGLGALLEAEPGRAFRVPVAGANPDVDTPQDLADLAGGRPGTDQND